MIARFRVLLPYSLVIQDGATLAPLDFEASGMSVRVPPPRQVEIDAEAVDPLSPVPLKQAADALLTATSPPAANPLVRLGETPAVVANVLEVRFTADDFDRTKRPGVVAECPEVVLAFSIVNRQLDRLRTLGRASHLRPVDPAHSLWRLDYLNDDETRLERDESLARSRVGVKFTLNLVGVTGELWQAASDLDADFTPAPWDTLLLDAFALLPEVGAALVLGYAALESRIADALDVLAAASLDPGLWQWITTRDDDFAKQPSMAERFGPLLTALSGDNLKDTQLWQGFQELRAARNSFAHTGRCVIGDTDVDAARARQLLENAGQIIDWIEARLPEQHRRPTYEPDPTATIETHVVTGEIDGPSTLRSA